MRHLKTLIAMQLRDKVDLSWMKNKKKALRQIILASVKFILLTVVTFILLFLSNRFQLFTFDESPIIVILVLTISLVLSLIGCTFELMKNLYFSEDNKVLITLPVNANKIFISKLAVYYIYELKRSLNFLIPITLGCNLLLVVTGLCNPLIFLWMWIPLVIIVALPVLLGALISIPVMYIYRLLKKNSIVELCSFLIALGLIIWAVISLINLIPNRIDLLNQWPMIRGAINRFLIMTEEKLFVMSKLIYVIIGEKGKQGLKYVYNLNTLLTFAIVIVTAVVLILLVYFISRPLFFRMMAKNFENNKKSNNKGRNITHKKYMTFVNKEFIINLRTINISVNYLMIYIIVPILVYLLNKIFGAMELSALGIKLAFIFNILLILLPLLASNALVATYFSREGRAGYLKKTKPIQIIYPLLAKLVFNIAFSLPTVFVIASIYGGMTKLSIISIILLGFAILCIHVGHMIYSAALDIMNPQNEQYATTGITIDNPNENKSTIVAFVVSAIFVLVAFMFYAEGALKQNLTMGFLKLMFVSIIYLGSNVYLFARKVKAFYYEIQGNQS